MLGRGARREAEERGLKRKARTGSAFAKVARGLDEDVSQAALARILNVSPRTVQAWETNARRPSDAALRVLEVAKKHPEALRK